VVESRRMSTQTESTSNEVELSIVMPSLNEAETLETCIRKAALFLEKHNVRGEIVVGDNGSTDGSIEIAQRCGARVVHVLLCSRRWLARFEERLCAVHVESKRR